ncbi:MAG: hypothetical protein U0641_19070 [Anaerolineae bacterium]
MNGLRIEAILRELQNIVTMYGVSQWIEPLEQIHRVFEDRYWSGTRRGKEVALQEASRVFGGMGSLRDLIITAAAGNRIRPEDEYEVNARLSILLDELYELIKQEKAKL